MSEEPTNPLNAIWVLLVYNPEHDREEILRLDQTVPDALEWHGAVVTSDSTKVKMLELLGLRFF